MVDFVFLDSGTGGIPYLVYLKKICPQANCVYVGDTANFPYGEKSKDQIIQCVNDITKKIIEKFDPKVIVIACNTMSVNALEEIREKYPSLAFVGTVPAIKLAASISHTKKIGLLATSSTCESPYNLELMKEFASDCELVTRADPKLISFIEHESFLADEIKLEAAVLPAVDYFRVKNCDSIILGCTHFLNLSETFQKVAGPKIKIVDSREGVCKRAINVRWGDKEPEYTSVHTSQIFVTGFSDKKDEKEYDVICNRYNLKFGGIL